MELGSGPISDQRTQEITSSGAETRILLIEDNPGDAKIAEILLNDGQHFAADLTWCKTLSEGIDSITETSASKSPYEVILLDLSLPDSSGIETFLRLHEKAPEVPIVVLSGHEDESLAADIVKHGGQDCLAKDMMTGPVIRRAVRHAIERKSIYEQLRSMQMQLIQAEKMESVGRLAAGVAHEVKNPLAQILMGIEYLKGGIEPDDTNVPKILDSMEHALHRADEIVRGLLDFSSERKLGLVETDVNAMVEKALILVEIRVKDGKSKVMIEKDLGEGVPVVHLDPVKIEQALINLIFNAVQAMEAAPDGGTLTVRTRTEQISGVGRDEGSRSARHLRDGDRVVTIEVLDEGPGIPDELSGNLFDPFFTTKPTGTGTGLGLTVVKKIIDLHQGLIELKNRPEGGAVAILTLKASSNSPD